MTGQKVKTVSDETVWELSLEDLVGADKMKALMDEQGSGQNDDASETKTT
jgi:hypothetical protein